MSGQNKIWLEYCNAVAFFKKNITTDFFFLMFACTIIYRVHADLNDKITR